jgi:hypothetical protein
MTLCDFKYLIDDNSAEKINFAKILIKREIL